MKFALGKKTIFFFSLAAATLVSVLVLFYYNTQKVKSTSDLVEHTEEVLRKSDNVLLDIINIETGLRGYMLTENVFFLTPFNNAVTALNNDIAVLATLTKDDLNQKLRIVALKKATEESLVFAKKSIEETMLSIEDSELEKTVDNRKGKNLTDKIRSIIADINSEEFVLLKQRRDENKTSSKYSDLIFLLLLVFIVVIFSLVIIIIKNQQTRNKISEELKQTILVAERATQKAEESTKLKEAFLANMSHEIRTPMNAIIGFSDILSKRKLGELEKEYVGTIKLAGENLLSIINEILDLSKIEAGMMTFEKSSFSVKETFKSLNLMLIGKAKEKNLELLFVCDEDVPDVLLGDQARLTQIIINLAGNAIKFTQKGKVQANVKVLKNENENTLLEFSIKDTGIGIPSDQLQHIFERFRQADLHTTRRYGGTGLGLSIAKQLVELQGGTLSVQSELKVGSIFSFCIPYKKSKEALPSSDIIEKKYSMEDLSKLNILLVEDNPLNIKFNSRLFS